jgi:hypothetical protein
MALVSGASLLINPVFVREPLGEYEFFVGLSVLEYDSTIELSITAGFIPPPLRHPECLGGVSSHRYILIPQLDARCSLVSSSRSAAFR